jgi:hypothetical protein
MSELSWRYRHNLLTPDGQEFPDPRVGELVCDPQNPNKVGIIIELHGAFQAKILWANCTKGNPDLPSVQNTA